MVNTLLKWLWCGLLGLTLIGCQGGGSPTAPVNEGEAGSTPARLPGTLALGSPQMVGDASLIPAALWDVTIDVESLNASVGKRPDERSGQSYAETYLMEVTRYFTPSVLQIEGVTRTAPGRIKVDYTIAHPFAAATDPDALASATNRADLGITGIVMFPLDVVDETPITYFAETARPIIANTDAIATADGYYVPAGLVYGLDMQANCFPFRRLVNDARRESRIGVPLVNLGVGNFDPNFGWQRSNWGPNQTGWTGYGALHQGQVARNSVELNLPADPITSISLPVMLIAKYLDPVGPGSSPADRSANRLPTADADRSKFLYRMPQAAWDLERVEVQVEGVFGDAGIDGVHLELLITDWDRLANETSFSDFREELEAGRINWGEARYPRFSIDLPTLPTIHPPPSEDEYLSGWVIDDDLALGGDVDADTGYAGDPYYCRQQIVRLGSLRVPAGEHVGMIRLHTTVDERSDATALSPWLAPLAQDVPLQETYQVFRVEVQSSPLAQYCYIWPRADIKSAGELGILARVWSAYLWAAPWLEIDWNGDGDWEDEEEGTAHQLTASEQRFMWPKMIVNATKETENRRVTLRIHFLEQVETSVLEYTVGPNKPPVVTSKYAYTLNAQRLSTPATFQLMGVVATDPENDPLGYAVATPQVPGITESDVVPFNLPGSPLSYPTHQFTRYSIYVTDPTHRGLTGTFIRSQLLRVDGAVRSGWFQALPKGSLPFRAHALTYDAQGNLYVATHLQKPWKISNLAFAKDDALVFSLAPQGEFRWAQAWRSPGSGSEAIYFKSLKATQSGELLISVIRRSDIDFGGGLRTDEGLTLLRLSAVDGSYISDRSWENADHGYYPELFVRPDSSILMLGTIFDAGPVSFGGPARELEGSYMAYALQLSAEGEFQWDYAAVGGGSKIVDAGLDAEGTSYLCGYHIGAVDYGAGLEITGIESGLILALSPQGTYRWARILETPSAGVSVVEAVAGDRAGGGCFASGWGEGDLFLGGGGPSNPGNGFWASYDRDGNWRGQRLEVGFVWDIEGLPNGDWLAGGYFDQPTDLGWGEVDVEYSDEDRFLVRLDAQLGPVWQTLWQNGSSDSLGQIAVSPMGQIAISALSNNTSDHDPGPAEYFSHKGTEAVITVSAETGQW